MSTMDVSWCAKRLETYHSIDGREESTQRQDQSFELLYQSDEPWLWITHLVLMQCESSTSLLPFT